MRRTILRLSKAFSMAAALFLAAGAYALDSDSIDKQAADKLAQAKRIYCDSVKLAAADAIRKYEALLKQETAAGHADAVQAIKQKIDKLKELEADPAGDLKIDQSALLGDGSGDDEGLSAAISGRGKLKQELEKRMRGFFGSLMRDEYEAAQEFLDPKSPIQLMPKDILQGHLKKLSGMLAAVGMKKETQMEVKDFTLNAQKNVAKVIPRWNGGDGGDPQYWIYRKGKWYLGDEKELSKGFK